MRLGNTKSRKGRWPGEGVGPVQATRLDLLAAPTCEKGGGPFPAVTESLR